MSDDDPWDRIFRAPPVQQQPRPAQGLSPHAESADAVTRPPRVAAGVREFLSSWGVNVLLALLVVLILLAIAYVAST